MSQIFKTVLSISIIAVFWVSNAEAQVVATVGSKKITLKEFNQKYNEILKQTVNPPSKSLFLEDLVRYEIGVQEARKRKLQNDPIVQEAIDKELYKGLLERELGKKVEKIKVTEKEMRAYYKKNPEIRTSHILIEHKPNANRTEIAAARKRAQEIFAEVKKSKRPFSELVKLYSDDVLSKQNGGDVGWQNRVTLVPPYYNAIRNLKTGRMTNKLVRTRFGFHIIKVTGRHSFQDANRRQIRAAVFDQKRKKLFDNFFKKLKGKYKISVNKGLVK